MAEVVEAVKKQEPADKPVQSPPAAEQPGAREEDPRVRLHQLAEVLASTQSRRMLVEYLRLRRGLR